MALQGILPGMAPRSDWRATRVADLPSWRDARRVCVDIECRDDLLEKLGIGVRRGGYVCGVAFAIEDGPAHYLPYRHAVADDDLDADHVRAYLRDQARDFRGEVVNAKLSFDLDYLATGEDVHFTSAAWFRDPLVAAALIDENQNKFGLEACCGRWGVEGKDERTLNAAAAAYGVDPKKDLWRMPARFVGPYAERDVRAPLELLRRQERDLDEQDLWQVWDLESRLLPVLVRMRRRGVRVDLEQLGRVEAYLLDVEQACDDEVHHLTGFRPGVGSYWAAAALEPVLNSVGIDLPRDGKNRPTVNAEVLDVDHPVARAVGRARDHAKVGQFAAQVRAHLVGDRVHPTLNQVKGEREDRRRGRKSATKGAGFGRLAGEDPNLQNQPARDDELGPLWRAVYVKDRGSAFWACCDISQQEPRLMVHYAALLGLAGAREFARAYADDPNTDFHTMTSKVTNLKRKIAKEVGLALGYGMGGGRLCEHYLKLPTEWRTNQRTGKTYLAAGPEGQQILDQFDRGVPWLKQLSRATEQKARRSGYIRTIKGRRCHFPKHPITGEYDWTHKAMSRLIQGGGADEVKEVLVQLDAAGFPLQLTVHDEVDWSEDSLARAREAAEIVRTAVPKGVPSKVDLELGPDWGHLLEHGKLAQLSRMFAPGGWE